MATDSRSALVVLPPEALMHQVQLLREQYDRAFQRWPPHVRICWPFVPRRTALTRLNEGRLEMEAFDLELTKMELLSSADSDRDRVYVGLVPSAASAERLEELWKEISAAFPECAEAPQFHLTLGQLPRKEAESFVSSAAMALPLRWNCCEVTLLCCDSSTEPLKSVHSVPLRPQRALRSDTPSTTVPCAAWRGILQALPLRDAACVRRVARQEILRDWTELARRYFPNGIELSADVNTFSSLAGAGGYAASLSWVAAKPGKASARDICEGVREMQDTVSGEVLQLPFNNVRCLRHNASRLVAAGEVSSKEAGLALWDLASLKDKPRFSKIKGQIKSFDMRDELLLVLGKGGQLSLHDLTDPRGHPTSLCKKEGQVLSVQWMQTAALTTFSQSVALIDVEAGKTEHLKLPVQDPVVCRLDDHNLAISTSSSCVLWDLRRSAATLTMTWPSSFQCRSMAFEAELVAGGSGEVPLHRLDLRASSWRQVHVPPAWRTSCVEVEQLLMGHLCVSAQFKDQSLATWHLGTGTPLGWWQSSRCLSLPSGSDAWKGLAAADDRLRVATAAKAPRKAPKAPAPKAPAKAPATENAESAEKSKKPKLRTSEDVYHRILHDAACFAPKDVSIGYEDRFLGPMEVKLLDFRPGGDIPFHRIYYFRRGAEVLWDRRNRLDRVFNTTQAVSTPVETENAIKQACRTAEKIEQGIIKVRGRRPAKAPQDAGMKYAEGGWIHSPVTTSVHLSELKVLTLNVLFELFGDVETHLQVRARHIFTELEKSNADVILLQEVTPAFAEMLLSERWVQDAYWSSGTASIHPSGQLTLSRLPMRSVECCRLSQHKTAVLVSTPLRLGPCHAALIVANIHLTADANPTDTRQAHRAEQLRTCEALMNERLQPGDMGIIAGDFNEREPVVAQNFRDAWESKQDSDGYTFDPTVNTVARHVVSAVGGSREPRRIDRVYVAGPWQLDAQLVATQPFELESKGNTQKWYMSDHFGVLCRVRSADAETGSSTCLRKASDCLAEDVVSALMLQDGSMASDSGVELFLLGSAALGITDSGSDVDVLACSSTLSSSKFFDAAMQSLKSKGLSVELVGDAAVPLLRFSARQVDIEVQFTELSPQHMAWLRDCHGAAVESFESLEALLFTRAQVGLAAALDAWALPLQLRHQFERFRGLVVEVKRWARQKQLLGTSFGFPGGFAWALLCKEVVMSSSEDMTSLDTSFFQGLTKRLVQEPPKLWCPAGPQDRNALRSMTRGTTKILKAQLEQASRNGLDAPGGVLESEQFLLVEACSEPHEAGKLLKRKAISILLEAERIGGAVWPLGEVHFSRRGMPCIVMGCCGWTPTPGEQSVLMKSLKSTSLDLQVQLIAAKDLYDEAPSIQAASA